MGARFNWVLHFGQAPRFAKDMKVIQLDIAPEEIHQNKPAEVALLGDGKAIMPQINQALAGRQWFHPKDTPWREALSKKAAENAAMIKPQIDDDKAPGNYYRLFNDIAEWMPKNVVLSARAPARWTSAARSSVEKPAPTSTPAATARWASASASSSRPAVVHPDRPVIHVSGDSAIGFSGMEMETLCRYNLPAKIVVLNNGGIGPGMPEIPSNPMINMRPNTLIWGARYDKMMEAFGGFGAYVKDPKDIKKALDEPMKFQGPGLVNIELSQSSARKEQQFKWHS